MKAKHYLLLTLFSLLFISSLATASTPPKPCQTTEHRAFDFWLGEWTVTTKDKTKPPAKSSITLSNNGCSIHERYQTPGGYTGNSINFYDAKTNKWHQTWIDNQGSPLYLDGEFKDGAMVLTDGVNRITWTLLKDGRVNQRWDTTQDKGKTWKTIFDGFYTRN